MKTNDVLVGLKWMIAGVAAWWTKLNVPDAILMLGLVAPAGTYRVTVYVKSEGDEVGSTLDLVVGWSDAIGAKVATVVDDFDLSAGNYQSASILVQTDGIADLTLTGTFSDMGDAAYSLYAICERIG